MSDQPNSSNPNSSGTPRWISEDQVQESLTFTDAVAVLEYTLVGGFDPDTDGDRTRHSGPSVLLLHMTSALVAWFGTQLVPVREIDELDSLPAVHVDYV